MTKLIQIQMPTEQVIWAQATTDGPSNVSATSVLQRLDPEELRSTIHAVSESLRQALEQLAPNEVSIEFGLEFVLKTGKLTSVLAEASGAASVKVAVTWKNDGHNPGSAAPGNGRSTVNNTLPSS